MSTLNLGIRLEPETFQRIPIKDVDFDMTIENLRSLISEKIVVDKDHIELVYCGNCLTDDMTIRSSGLRPGSTLHVLRKLIEEPPILPQPITEADIRNLISSLKTLTSTPSHLHSLQKLTRPEVIENIIMITPGLKDDPIAHSLIQDPELLVRISSSYESVKRIAELHPSLVEATNLIAATVHEETIKSRDNRPGPSTSSGYSILDLLSDDDEIESSQSSDSLQPGVSRQPSFSRGITSSQVAAALASANSGASGSENREVDLNGSTITPEMVSEAMQRAMAGVSSINQQTTVPGQSDQQLNEQMRQMRELGLTDDALNLQALQLSGGNLHAAVDLVFSGGISNDSNN